MPEQKKIYILLPDGIGLRNFAYTSFASIGKEKGWNIVYWNHTPFNLTELGLQEQKLEGRASALTDLYKRARKEIELTNFEKQYQDSIYNSYRFKAKGGSIKNKVKNGIVRFFEKKYAGDGLHKLREKIKDKERSTSYYKDCVAQLKKTKPHIVFCTNQRPVHAIAPILAAQYLGIPTATFIFSWDNVPKAMLVVETDFYYVWSTFMKEQLMGYYPHITEDQIVVTGTPQFEPHYEVEIKKSKKEFCETYSIPQTLDYICFSGDDVTTSPHDPIYLHDIATAVKKLNAKGRNLGIIFRRCPVDFSDRFDQVLEMHKDIVYPIAPKWDKIGGAWNTILPSQEDMTLLANTVRHSMFAINLGSSMVFDYISQKKPCLYIKYNPKDIPLQKDVFKVYDYVHFRSMPNAKAVFWINSKEDIETKIEQALTDPKETCREAHEWFSVINTMPPEKASERIWFALEKTIDTCI
ncbi:UDP-glycosyltransferase [Dokdonia ponticola]|uniref:UDP-glycosyltransferase n=1 Tax=Dokdonia ponticola TaxID=2041041 RepID=A0ABV9I1K2_9FLAO